MKTPFHKAALCIFLAAGASTLAQAQVVDKNPVLHMSFDNVNGTTVVNDGTGGAALNGTLNGSATIVAGGKFGNCLSISGATASDASVRIANAVVPLTIGNNWTVAMWVQTTTEGGCYAYQGDGGWGPNNTSFYLNNGSGAGTRQGGVRYGTGWEEGSTDINDGLWHHLVMTCSNSVKTLYLDGNVDPFPVPANNYGGDGWTTTAAGGQFWIGGNGYSGDGSANLNGLIDEVYIFNRALSQSDVQALVSSNYVPHVPVTVTVNPASGYRGQVFTVTAVATPISGFSVTNATVDLSGLALSATATLVLSNNNVFTNTFTVPANSPIGVANVKATVIDNESLIGSAGTTFTLNPKPPTNAVVLTQITGPTNFYTYTEASYTFNATNDSPDHFFAMNYAWYTNGVLVSTNPMGPNYTFLTTPADNGKTIQCVANIVNTNYSNLAVTSAVITMSAQPGALVYTNGLKREFFPGASRADAEVGNTVKGAPVGLVTNADFAGGGGNNYAERYSGFFIPPTNGYYVFFVAADDDTDVYLSTDSTSANKQLICQEAGFSGMDNWLTAGGNGSASSQKRSDQWSPDGGVTTPYSAGIPLVGGQLYYFESDHHQGTGGDNWAVTFQTTNSLADPSNVFNDGTPSVMTATNNNIAVVTWPGTNIVWTRQLVSQTVFEGDTAVFTAIAVSDAEMAPYYTWYVNGVAVSGAGGANGTNLVIPLVTLGQNGTQVSVVASTEAQSISSGPVTLTVNRAVFEPGFAKEDKWLGLTSRIPIENGTAGNPTFSVAMPGFEQGANGPGGQGDFGMRLSGFFIPPTSGAYVFFISSDDDSDLFLSTDDITSHKRLIAQETAWSPTFSWTASTASSVSQKRSDQWLPTGVTTPPYAAGITLNAGQKYFMEVDHHNGAAGGTHVGVYYKLIANGDPAVGAPPNTTGNVIGINAVRSNVGFTQQPANATAEVGGYATFSALGTTDSQLPVANSFTGNESRFTNNYVLYQWYKNGVPLTNATSPSVTVGPLEPGDAGASVICQIRSLGYADASFNPIWSNSLPATITLSPSQAVFEPGYIQHDLWTNQTSRITIEGGAQGTGPYITYATAKFEGPVNNNSPNNYVQRLTGYFVPPTDGNYGFFVNSDDDSDLFLSTDSTRANERIIAQEGVWSNPFQWNNAGGGGSTSQKSSLSWSPDGGITVPYSTGIPLVHGQKYYIELVHHNGGGGNNAEVTYYNINTEQPPNNGDDTKLTNNVIGMYAPRVASMVFTLQPVSQSATSGGNSVSFSANGNSTTPAIQIGTTGDFQPMFTNPAPSVLYQWYKNGVPIPGANSSNYTQIPILPSDNGAQFICGIRVLGYSDNSLTPVFSNSVPAVLTVVTDTVPPVLTYAATLVNSNQDPALIVVDVTFNKWMDSTTANNPLNYTVAGASVLQAILASNHRTVELVLNQVPTLPLNVTVNNVQDVSGNTIAANSSTPINPVQLTFQDIGTPGTSGSFGQPGIDPAYPSFIWVEGTNGFLVSAEGSDIFGTADGFNFGWELKTNDFDVVVRGVSNGHTSNFAKAGLMVREDLTASSRNWSVVNDPASADGIQAPDNSGFGANNIECNMRATNGVGTISWKTNTSVTVPQYPNAWVRIKRTGSVLTAYSSTNGVNWVALGAYDSSTNANGALPAGVYVGICTTAHNNDSATANPPPPPYNYYNTAEYANYNSSFVPIVPSANLTARVSGTNLVVSWTPAGGHLESSPALSGPSLNWQSLGAANPATNPISSGNQFFRVVNP